MLFGKSFVVMFCVARVFEVKLFSSFGDGVDSDNDFKVIVGVWCLKS